jgi:hypothetical protein
MVARHPASSASNASIACGAIIASTTAMFAGAMSFMGRK